MLLLADRGFGCYPFFSGCIKTGASLAFQVHGNMKFAKEKNLPDVFRGADLDSPDMEHIDWQTVRDDTEGFIQDVIDEAKKRLTE